jgi:uncharacterized protein (TIGR03435 family)
MKTLSPILCALSLCIVLIAPYARAQYIPLPTDVQPGASDANVKLPDFDVVSVRENKGDSHMMRWMYTPDGINITNLSVKNLVASAYNIRQYLISGGPSWVDSTAFDVQAKVADADVALFKKLPPTQRGLMLRKLLIERFHLAAHIETKTLPVYDLVVASGGPKFKAAAPDPPLSSDADPSDKPKPRGMITMGRGMTKMDDVPITALTNQLGYALDRPVIDKTGLTGKYDLSLKWRPDNQPPSDKGSDDELPGLFTALQEQLGLKLEPSKGPVDTLIIDHVEMPTEN